MNYVERLADEVAEVIGHGVERASKSALLAHLRVRFGDWVDSDDLNRAMALVPAAERIFQ